jgi:hypothetical protein
MSRVTFPFILLFDLLFGKDSSRQGSGEAIGTGALSVIVPNSCFRRGSRHFHFAGPRGEHEPALQNFHTNEMAL